MPKHWQVSLIHEMVRDVDLDLDVDAVFLSTLDFCAPHARHLAGEFRKRDVKVIVGGIYPTLNPGYFKDVADAVVVGEAEPVWSRLIADLEARNLQPIYVAERPADISELPQPNYNLVETAFQVPMAYEVTRGCPFRCSFCVLSATKAPHRKRPIAHILRDISATPSHWSWLQRKYLVFWDNNFGADRHYARDVCEAMIPLKRIWGTETSIDTVSKDSARLFGRAGCRYLYIGLESLAQDSLTGANKRQNKVNEYKERLRLLHENGVLVMSIFLIGLDADTVQYFDRLPELVHEIAVDVPVYSFAAPIEGTPFYHELKTAGRLLPGNILDEMDGTYLTYQPQNVSADELELALFQCMQRSYSARRVMGRVIRGWRMGFWTGLANTMANTFYTPHQLALARVGIERIKQRGPWPGKRSSA